MGEVNFVMKKLLIIPMLLVVALSFSNAWAQTKTIKRTEVPALVQGSALKALDGKPIASMSLMVIKKVGGKLEPIPFQIDERDASGSYVFNQGPEKSADADNGALDGNDELAFMVKDTGDQAPKAVWPPDATIGVEIKVIDTTDGGLGWAYLV